MSVVITGLSHELSSDVLLLDQFLQWPESVAHNEWKRVRTALLTMQRERDEARERTTKAIEIGAKHVHGLQAERDAAREQLAASERTCAELRAERDELQRCFDMALAEWDIEYEARTSLKEQMRDMRAHAEAAERTVEGLRETVNSLVIAAQDVCRFDWSDNDDDAVRAIDRLEAALDKHAELARLEGEGGK